MVIPKATGSYRHIHITHKFLRLHEMRRPYVFLSFIILKARVMVIVNIEGLNWIHCHYSDSEAPSTPRTFFRSLRFVGKKFRYRKKNNQIQFQFQFSKLINFFHLDDHVMVVVNPTPSHIRNTHRATIVTGTTHLCVSTFACSPRDIFANRNQRSRNTNAK